MVVSLRSCQKPFKREAGPRMDLLQAKTKPIRNGGSASVIMFQKREGKAKLQQQLKRGVRVCGCSSPADIKVSAVWPGDAPGRAETPLQPMVKTCCAPAAHGGP